MGAIPKNESKASWTWKQKIENPEAARVNVPLRNGRSDHSYEGAINFVEKCLNEKLDAGRGYKGKHPDKGRKPGSRVELINGKYELVYVTQ